MKRYAIPMVLLGICILGLSIYIAVLWRHVKENMAISTNTDSSITEKSRSITSPSISSKLNIATPIKAEESTITEQNALRQDIIALQDKLGDLTSDQAALQQSLNELQSIKNQSNDISTEKTGLNQEESFELAIAQQQAAIELQFSQEEIDPEWAMETESAIGESLQVKALQGINFVDAACASTLCRVELSLNPDMPPEDAMEKLAHHHSWNGDTFLKVGLDGQVQIYFAREGHELPPLKVGSSL